MSLKDQLFIYLQNMINSRKEIMELTQENADRFELCESTDSAASESPTRTSSPENPVSVIDTLLSIQQGNPQIETIFIESDEDEEQLVKKHKFVHDVRKVSPPSLTPRPPPPNVDKKSPFFVREISPSRLTTNLVKDANTIVLQDASKGSSSRSYLVIPKEVLPLLSRSKGPVALNIPGIGSVVISKPTEIITPLPANVNNQPDLNQVNPSQVPVEKPSTELVVYNKPYDPLTDVKYCWRFRRAIKRDLDGFSLNDRLGFNKSEAKRSKLCLMRCKDNVKKLQLSINLLKRKLTEIQNSKLTWERIKVVEIDKIKNSKTVSSEGLSSVQKKNLKTLISWKQRFNKTSDDSDCTDDDLWVPQKVESRKEGKKRGRKPGQVGKKDKDHTYSMPSFFSEYSNLMANTEEDESPNKRTSQGILPPGDDELVNIPRKRGRPRKVRDVIRSCSVKISPIDLKQEALEKCKQGVTRCEVIGNMQDLQNEIDSLKPILVVNEEQCAKLDLTELCSKNNLIFPTLDVNELSRSFVTAAETCNVKFVKPDVLCKYLSGIRE